MPPCEKDMMLFNDIMYALLPPLSTLGLATHGYWLDTYYWTYTTSGSARNYTWARATIQQAGHTGAVEGLSILVWVLGYWTELHSICVAVFLLRDGSLTVMNIASFIVLVRLCHTSCLVLFNIPEQKQIYTTLVPCTVLTYYKVHFAQTWWSMPRVW